MTKIEISGVIGGWEVDPAEIVSEIRSATGDIELFIDSPGGSVISGFSIFNALKDYKKGEVFAKISAVGASIASYIVMAAKHVQVYSNTVFMIHNAWIPTVGDFKKLREAADISEALSNIIAKAYVEKTAINEKDIKTLMNNESFFYGSEIVDKGFADEMVKIDEQTPKAEAFGLAHEKLKACNNAIIKHTDKLEFEAVAKLIEWPKKKKTMTLSAKQLRDIQIYEREVKI